jgi:beta-phosphoglucomutase-like phosphatase (HAD superfamily)
MEVVITLSSQDYDAVLFDLDGVLTRTASVHATTWKKLFDGVPQGARHPSRRAVRPL